MPLITLLERYSQHTNVSRAEASDIVQQTLWNAWQREAEYADETHEQRLALQHMIVENTVRDHQRRLLGTENVVKAASTLRRMCLIKTLLH